ncbi:tripartite tricarboxylate transporter permease [Fredinandcohnia sp. 179-A 10B2 NHS]|uniref:tripartite tricarboxylate transporter permease n=1 Tax=Fredinandcohnia sp. 179-A 10B2 NHS TaxID=3235176 RepID=UPI0039A3876A
MSPFDLYTAGLSNVFVPEVIMMLLIGTLAGVIIGALPGLTATMGVAVMTPLTFGMSAEMSFALLLGVFSGGVYGGSMTAVLANIPGTPSSMMTALDGYPLGQKGEAGKAIGMATIASFIGGLISAVILSIFAPSIARVALNFSAQEYFAVALFGLGIIAFISNGSMIKGLLSGCLGLLIATVGMDPMTGFERFTAGSADLLSGVELLPVLIGIFGLGEILIVAFSSLNGVKTTKQIGKIIPSKEEIKENTPTIFRGSIIGSFIGAIPAAGGTIAGIIAYGFEKRISRNPEKFGTGYLKGVSAPESANNATTGGAMIPMLTLGIPGDAITAILIGALVLHGLQPGPLLFQNNPDIVSMIFILLLLSNFAFLAIGLLGARVVSKVMTTPMGILLPTILILCAVGTYSIRNSFFDLGVLIVFGIVGFLFNKADIPAAPLVLGLILGPLVEQNLRRSLVLSEGDFLTFFTRPISATFLVLTILVLVFPLLTKGINKLKPSKEDGQSKKL